LIFTNDHPTQIGARRYRDRTDFKRPHFVTPAGSWAGVPLTLILQAGREILPDLQFEICRAAGGGPKTASAKVLPNRDRAIFS